MMHVLCAECLAEPESAQIYHVRLETGEIIEVCEHCLFLKESEPN
jgi:hypothetical protein